jgi:hypothetical protein
MMRRKKVPPRVETEVSCISFPIQQVMQAHGGAFVHYLTNFRHAINYLMV